MIFEINIVHTTFSKFAGAETEFSQLSIYNSQTETDEALADLSFLWNNPIP